MLQGHVADKAVYINSGCTGAEIDVAKAIRRLLDGLIGELVFLCIGTHRIPGDSLGPRIGQSLKASPLAMRNGLHISGTLQTPVHAKNLQETIENIYRNCKNAKIVAIDASLGRPENVGFITLGQGSLNPGIGINKRLPPVGDIFITGIVNHSGDMNLASLQNSRISTVTRLADVISNGIVSAICNKEFLWA